MYADLDFTSAGDHLGGFDVKVTQLDAFKRIHLVSQHTLGDDHEQLRTTQFTTGGVRR